MPRTQPSEGARRAAGLLTTVMLVVGTCGSMEGAQAVLTDAPPLPAPVPVDGDSASRDDAAEAVARRLRETLHHAPYRAPLSAAQLLVSVLLLVAMGLLMARRTTAPWWITQAVIANVLWTVASGASRVWALAADYRHIATYYGQEAVAENAENGAGSELVQTLDGEGRATVLMVQVGIALGIHLLLFAWIGWRARRPDIRAMLEDQTA